VTLPANGSVREFSDVGGRDGGYDLGVEGVVDVFVDGFGWNERKWAPKYQEGLLWVAYRGKDANLRPARKRRVCVISVRW
jgi:hypothetical protein